MMNGGGSGGSGAIEVTTGFVPLAFILYATKTRVVVDRQLYDKLPWGAHTFPVGPGRHRVRVSFNYLFPKDAGANEVDVDVAPGQTVRVGYRAPWLVFLKGPMTVASGAGAAASSTPGAAGAGWQPDPSRRYESRYWDGQAWTEHVSDQGVAGVDPPLP